MLKSFKNKILICCATTLSLTALEFEDLTWENQGPSAQEFNSQLQTAIEEKNWWSVIDFADIIAYHFPSSPFAIDLSFTIGQAYYNLGELIIANDYFNAYLKNPSSPEKFEESIAYKFEIASRFANGEKKSLFNSHKAPKLLSGKEDAITIFEEVIATVPYGEYAAKSLLAKAKILAEFEDYKPSIDTLDLLIRRFPKHELTALGYLEKIHVYYLQCHGKSLDPDLLDLADITLKKFKLTFPREEKICEAEGLIKKMEEAFAEHLLGTGAFFHKTSKLNAAKIYYEKVIQKYPGTQAAITAQEKLSQAGFKNEKPN